MLLANPKWRTGSRAFRLTSSSTNSQTGVFTSAETDYTAKGMIQQVQGTVVSTREPQVQRTTTTESTSIQVAVADRVIVQLQEVVQFGREVEVIQLLKDSISIKKMDYL